MATNNQLNTATTPISVAKGGTGLNTLTTAYAPVCSGITTTGALQAASTGLSTSGFVLTSNGSSVLPSFQTPLPQKTTVTLTASNIQNMYATPVQLIAAQGANTFIVLYSVMMQYVFNTAAFATGPAGQSPIVQYGNTTHGGGVVAFQAPMDLRGSSSSLCVGNLSNFVTLGTNVQGNMVNQGLYATNNTAAYTAGGSSSVIVTLLYTVLTTTL